jgi:hypothetical protein
MTLAYILLGADNQELINVTHELWANEEILLGDSGEDKTSVWPLSGDPREELQKMPQRLHERGLELGRILALLDASALEQTPSLMPWAEMLAYFADGLLLQNASKVAPAFLRELRKKWSNRPLLIFRWPEEAQKKEELLYPEARRLSQYFDDDAPWNEALHGIPLYTDEDDEDTSPSSRKKINMHVKAKTNVHQANLDELEPVPEEKYFARNLAGSWAIKIQVPKNP